MAATSFQHPMCPTVPSFLTKEINFPNPTTGCGNPIGSQTIYLISILSTTEELIHICPFLYTFYQFVIFFRSLCSNTEEVFIQPFKIGCVTNKIPCSVARYSFKAAAFPIRN